jgi:alpha/beta superfamily hydrolase
MTQSETTTTELIKGPAGLLEIKRYASEGLPQQAWGIVCHPHPLFGGSMHNKVVTTIVKAFQQLGVNTITFNFRGVGRSEGVFDQGRGELEDLFAVIDWMQQQQTGLALWLGGFSFGGYIVAKAATQIPVTKLLLVAPPVVNFAMDTLPPILCPFVLAQGERDEVVSAEKVYAWCDAQNPRPEILRFPDAGHFFHGQLVELRQGIVGALGVTEPRP